MTRDELWKKSLFEIAQLQVELDENGGPLHNNIVADKLGAIQKTWLKTFGLPDTIDFSRLIQFENIPGELQLNHTLELVKKAATEYLLSEAKSEMAILQSALDQQSDALQVLPQLNIRVHIYSIFVYDKILLQQRDTIDHVWQELLLTQDPEVILYTGKIAYKDYDFNEHLTYKKILQQKGLRYLDVFIATQETLMDDDEEN